MTADTVVHSLLAAIRAQFCRGLDDKSWYQDHYHFMKKYVVLWPARFCDKKGFTLAPARYEAIMRAIFTDVKRHGQTGAVRHWPGYLTHCVQEHFKHHWEEYYQEAKSIRNAAESALLRLGKLPTASPSIEPLATAHRLLTARPRKTQEVKKQLPLL